jgi:hypothetical protein
MAAKGGDLFPDLHHKMSKKIAQLTKVIYHLNTKNEDRQIEVRCQKFPFSLFINFTLYITNQIIYNVSLSGWEYEL